MLPGVRSCLLLLVLIETYWNVNRSPAAEEVRLPSINRNILECKFRNVVRKVGRFFVLIETYWNVNVDFHRGTTHSRSGINRNILECK